MFNYCDSYTIDKMIKSERRRESKKGVISSDVGWRNDSYGSASCASSTMGSIFEAYNEYRSCTCY